MVDRYERNISKNIPGLGIVSVVSDTVPSDGDSGYATGCILQHTDGSAGSVLYVNVGSNTSCDFDAIDEDTLTNIADSAVKEQHLGKESSSGITKGAIAAKVIESAELEALLDGNENNLFAVNEGDVILDAKLVVQTAAGAICAVTIGTDAAVDGTTKDVDSLLKAGDANSTGVQAATDPAGTYLGDDLAFGSFIAQGNGNVTISASTNQSSSNFVGKVVMTYIPA